MKTHSILIILLIILVLGCTSNTKKSENHSETKALFEWIASRNSDEWAYIRGKENQKEFSFIGTLHDDGQAPSLSRSKLMSSYETIIDIHSHYGTALYDFEPSSSDRVGAQKTRAKFPKAKFYIFSPFISKENYNKAIEGRNGIKYGRQKIDYEPGKYIPY